MFLLKKFQPNDFYWLLVMSPNPGQVTMDGCCHNELSYYSLSVEQLQDLSMDYIIIKFCLCAVQLGETLQIYQMKHHCTTLQKNTLGVSQEHCPTLNKLYCSQYLSLSL